MDLGSSYLVLASPLHWGAPAWSDGPQASGGRQQAASLTIELK